MEPTSRRPESDGLLSFFRRCLCPLAAALVLLAAHPAAFADDLTLTDSERLVGKVDALTGEKLTFTSDKLGAVSVATSDIRTLTTATPVPVFLKNGAGTSGKGLLHGAAEGRAVVELGGQRRDLPIADVETAPVPAAAPRWNGTATVGLTLGQDRLAARSLALAVKANRQTKGTNTILDAAYLNSRDGNVTAEDYAFLNGEHRFAQNEGHSGFINGSIQTDEVQKLDLRVLLGGGRSFPLKTGSAFRFRTDAGLTVRCEDFQAGKREQRLAAQLGYGLGGTLSGSGLTLLSAKMGVGLPLA